MEIIEKAPAKINLSLDVLSKRSDGFHEMEMIMTSIDLADWLTFTLQEEGTIQLTSDSSFMPHDERNIVFQTALLVKNRFKITQGVSIHIEKHIPIAAGLGGGSSDAAATLRGLNRLWEMDLSLDQLAELGEEIGSDVPFCVYGKTAYATGRGEKIELIENIPPCWVVLVKPHKGLSSWKVFENLEVEKLPHFDTQAILEAIEAQSYTDLVKRAGNALEGISVLQQPKIEKIKERMLKFGADTALMSGTGPTIYGLCKHHSRAKRVVNGLKGFCDEVYLVRTLK
ncbi:4-(cytidine 5'-diphospho)-2-C-methyl-D-erythritol kinase [Lacticigenium naphthae]|uniref:4-(cytidine 5'-diphospho)-2-C-methyl-D-erythritol kinase n=1 Tax=Lacticigenium naphthae TaxID=515351 RepID=UPI000414B99B|nr:4-(cytidine 5'-diphospho)-2-C-methyl-D-erythritol kinase [Lacticigenium naphthae]